MKTSVILIGGGVAIVVVAGLAGLAFYLYKKNGGGGDDDDDDDGGDDDGGGGGDDVKPDPDPVNTCKSNELLIGGVLVQIGSGAGNRPYVEFKKGTKIPVLQNELLAGTIRPVGCALATKGLSAPVLLKDATYTGMSGYYVYQVTNTVSKVAGDVDVGLFLSKDPKLPGVNWVIKAAKFPVDGFIKFGKTVQIDL